MMLVMSQKLLSDLWTMCLIQQNGNIVITCRPRISKQHLTQFGIDLSKMIPQPI